MSDRGPVLKPGESPSRNGVAWPTFGRAPEEQGFSGERVQEVSVSGRSVREDVEAMRLALTREVNRVKSELEVLSRRVRDLETQPALVGFEGRLDSLEAKVEALTEAVKRYVPPHATRRDSGFRGLEGT